MKILAALIVFLLSSSSAFAARPLSTDDTGTTEKAHLEAECGFEYVNNSDNECNWITMLKYGFTESWDAGVETPYQFIDVAEDDNVDGIGDVVIFSKYRLLEESENLPALALSFKLKTKTGNENKNLGTGDLDYGIIAILARGFNNAVAYLNMGYTYAGGPEGTKDDDLFSYALALECPLNDKVNLMGEFSGETNFAGDFEDNPLAGLIGFNYVLSEIATVDFGVGWQVSEASPDYKIISGITLGF